MSSNLRTDEQGAVVKRTEYLPFGSTRSETGSYDRIKLRYTSQYEDEESGLY